MRIDRNPTVKFSYSSVRKALHEAIVYKEYDAIDSIIKNDIKSLTQIRNGRTAIFSIISELLGGSLTLYNPSQRIHVMDLAMEGLTHVFGQIAKNPLVNSDNDISQAIIHSLCNHISHTSLLSQGATVRDVMEEYARVDLTAGNYGKEYKDFAAFVKEFGLMRLSDVAKEETRTLNSSANERGR